MAKKTFQESQKSNLEKLYAALSRLQMDRLIEPQEQRLLFSLNEFFVSSGMELPAVQNEMQPTITPRVGLDAETVLKLMGNPKNSKAITKWWEGLTDQGRINAEKEIRTGGNPYKEEQPAPEPKADEKGEQPAATPEPEPEPAAPASPKKGRKK